MNNRSGIQDDVGRRLLLVRHAETADNVAGRFLGRSDSPITEGGIGATAVLAAVLAHRMAADDLVVVSSPARRAIETAQHLGLHDPLVDDGFREIDFGEWEGFTQSEVARNDPETFAAFDRGEIAGFPGGESVESVRRRTLEAIDRHRVDRLLVVTHATVLRIVVTSLLGLPVDRYRSLFGRPANLSMTELERTDVGWRLLSYGVRVAAPRT